MLTGFQPSDIHQAGGCITGFFIENGKFKGRSLATNTSKISNSKWNDGNKDMDDEEKALIKNATDLWIKSGCKT